MSGLDGHDAEVIRLTMIGQGKPVPVLLPLDLLGAISPSDADHPDGPATVQLKQETTIANRWYTSITTAESMAAIEAALEAIGVEVARPAASLRGRRATGVEF